MMNAYQFTGLVGAAVAMVAYYLTQVSVVRADGWEFPLLNLLAGSLIAISLIDAFNLPSLAIQAGYGVISIIGLGRYVLEKING